MASYGVGQVGEALVTVGFNTFLLFYYNQVLGVSGTLTGAVLAVSLVLDAFVDPVAGAISDRLHSRYGRRHPFMVASAVPLGAFFFLIFNPPSGLDEIELAAWLLAFTLLTRLAMTFYTVPHLALGAEMAHEYDQRSTLYSLNTLFAALGGAFGTAAAYRLFFPTTPEFSPGVLNPAGYATFSLAFAAGIAVAILVAAFGTRREIPHLPRTGRDTSRFTLASTLRETLEAFRNRSFRALFFGMGITTLMLSMEGVLGPYMGLHFWGLTTEQISVVPVFQLVGLVVGVAVTPVVTRWLDKKRTVTYSAYVALVSGNVIVVLRLLDVPGFPENGSVWILVLVIVTSFVNAVADPMIFGSVNGMFADIVDEHELDTGHRREGIVFAARSFLVKAASSIGLVLGGWVIDWVAFPQGARAGTVEDDVLWTLGLFQMPLPSIFVLIGVFMISRYRLDRSRHAEIVEQLARQRTFPMRTSTEDHAAS
jgi:Na+/melibiose symporter-like transporter